MSVPLQNEAGVLLSISVRLRCSFSVSSLTRRRSSSSAFRNSLSLSACCLRWLCSANSASSSLTRPRKAWHRRPLWGIQNRPVMSITCPKTPKIPLLLLTSHWWNMFHALSHHFSAFLRFTNLQPEWLQLFFQGLELCGQLLDESVSEGIEKYVTTLRSAQATRQLPRKPWFGPRSEYFKRNNDPDCTHGGGFPRDRHNLALAQIRDSQTLNPRPHSNAKAKLLRHSYHF